MELILPAVRLVQRGGDALQTRLPDVPALHRVLAVVITVTAALAGMVAVAVWLAVVLAAFTAALLFWWLPVLLLNWLVSATSYRVTVDRKR